MCDVYIGTIVAWAAPYEPRGWKYCNGQLLQISEYATLYAVIGNTYGGDGYNTFALPNLNGRVPVGANMGGAGTGYNYPLGMYGGSNTTRLDVDNLPVHSHEFNSSGSTLNNASANVSIPVCNNDGTTGTPSNTTNLGVAKYSNREVDIYSSNEANDSLKSFNAPVTGEVSIDGAIGNTGSNEPFNNMQPFSALNYIICIDGIFPPRN